MNYTGATDPVIETYLTTVHDLINNEIDGVELSKHGGDNDTVWEFYIGRGEIDFAFIVKFIKTENITSLSLEEDVKKLLVHHYHDDLTTLIGIRLLLSDNTDEMSRTFQMADHIVKSFQKVLHKEVATASIASFKEHKYFVDWRLSEAKRLENEWSPYGIRPRMEVALTLKVRAGNDYIPFGVIGGYTSFREKEEHLVNDKRVLLYKPVFNITYCHTQMSIPEAGLMLLATFAPTLYSTKFYATQWQDSLGEGNPQPGLLENRVLATREELLDFLNTSMATPIIACHHQEGREADNDLLSYFAADNNTVSGRLRKLNQFFATSRFDLLYSIHKVLSIQYDGVYHGVDSRTIDVLDMINQFGHRFVANRRRAVLLNGNSRNPFAYSDIMADQYLQHYINLFRNITTVINPELIKTIVEVLHDKEIIIIDPGSKPSSAKRESPKVPFDSLSTPLQQEGVPQSIWNEPTDFTVGNKEIVSAEYFIRHLDQEIARVKNWLNEAGFDSTTSINYIARQYRTDLKRLRRQIQESLED